MNAPQLENLAVSAAPGGVLTTGAIPEPNPAPHEAVVAIAYGGICGSDLHYWQHGAAGESILQRPMALGHEVVGTILHAAADGSGPRPGTPVAVHPATRGEPAFRYPNSRPNLSGGTYLGSAARDPHTEGAFARRVAFDTAMLRVVPDGLDLTRAALAEPAAVAWHAAVRAGDLTGARVLVIGAGPIGALIVAVAKTFGAAHITATDLHPEPLDVAAAVGADVGLDARDSEAIDAVDADVTFESSGSWRGFTSALRGTSRGGRVVMVGLQPTGEQPALLSLIVTRELDVVGSFRFNDEIDDALAALASGQLSVDPIITHTFPAGDALAAFEVAADPRQSCKVLLDFSS